MFSILYQILTVATQTLAGVRRLDGRLTAVVAGQAALATRLDEQAQTLAHQTELLTAILDRVTPPPGAVRVVFAAVLDGQSFPGVDSMTIKDNQEFDVNLTFQDAGGQPASVDGVPAWTNNNEAVLTLTVAADGMSAVVAAAGPPGSGQISVSADSDLGGGTTTITGVLDVEVLAGDATVIVLNSGPPRDKAAP